MNDNEQSHIYAPSEQRQHACADTRVRAAELSLRADKIITTASTNDGNEGAVEKPEVNA